MINNIVPQYEGTNIGQFDVIMLDFSSDSNYE